MTRQNRVVLVLALIFLCAGVLLQQWLHDPAVESPAAGMAQHPVSPPPTFSDIIGQRRPGFSLSDVSGKVRDVSEWDGSVILINFWATWCLPCLEEVPELVRLQQDYGERGLQVIGIALQQAEELHGFIREHHMNYPVLAGQAAVIKAAEDYGNNLGALPYTAIIDRDGTVIFTRPGPVTYAEVQAIIDEVL